MLDITDIFKNKTFNEAKLLNYGFIKTKNGLFLEDKIMDNGFLLQITISKDKYLPVIKVIDIESNEEYGLIHSKSATGGFVGQVIEEVENKLNDMAAKCCDFEVFKTKQAKEIIDYVKKKYNNELEFLWKKFSDNAILRRSDNKKWYLAMLTVQKNKIGLKGIERIEIIDLKETPEKIEELVDNKKYFKGYHMNKKHWYTICLDDGISTKEILDRIDKSYLLA